MKNISTATEARKNFFDIVNNVLYNNEDYYITKAGVKAVMVKVSRVVDPREEFLSLAGSISNIDANKIKSTVKTTKGYKSRKINEFS